MQEWSSCSKLSDAVTFSNAANTDSYTKTVTQRTHTHTHKKIYKDAHTHTLESRHRKKQTHKGRRTYTAAVTSKLKTAGGILHRCYALTHCARSLCSTRQHTQHTSGYVSVGHIRQDTSGYVRIRERRAYIYTSAYRKAMCGREIRSKLARYQFVCP